MKCRDIFCTVSIIVFTMLFYTVLASQLATSGKPDLLTLASTINTQDEQECPDFLENPDGKEAFAYWESACGGNAEAQYRLACCCDAGKGVKQDEGLAFTWFLKAAKQHNTSAQLAVAVCHGWGIGVPVNVDLALKQLNLLDVLWQRAHHKSRLQPACFALARIYTQLAENEAFVVQGEDLLAGEYTKAESEALRRRVRLYRFAVDSYIREGKKGLRVVESYARAWHRWNSLLGPIEDTKQPVEQTSSKKTVAVDAESLRNARETIEASAELNSYSLLKEITQACTML